MNDHIRLQSKEHILDFIKNYKHSKSGGAINSFKESEFLNIIQYLEKTDSSNKALEILDLAISMYKYSPELHEKKAQFLLANNLADLALESLDRAEMFGTSFIKIELLRITAYNKLQDYQKAKDALYALRINYKLSDKELSESFVLESEMYRAQNRYDEMYQSLKQALREDSCNEIALKNIWLAMEMSQQCKDGITFHNELLTLDAYQYLAWFNLGHAYFNNCEYDKALDAFEFAILTNEQFLPAYIDYVETAIVQQKYYLAINCIENARSYFDLNDEMLFKLGVSYQAIHLYDKARTQFFQASRQDNYNPDIYFRIGQCYLSEKRYKDALHYLKKAINLNSENEEYHTAIAQAFVGLEDSVKAIKHFKKATFLAPHEDFAWTKYAEFLLSSNDLHKALNLIKEAEEYTVGSAISYLKAAALYLLNDKDSALKELEEGLIDNFNGNDTFLKFLPSSVLLKDRKLAAIFRYYQP